MDLTPHVENELKRASLSKGTVTVCVSGSTAGITALEFETGLVQDVRTFFETIAPQGKKYIREEPLVL